MSTNLLFSHADTQPYTNTVTQVQQRRNTRQDARKPTQTPKATVDDVDEHGPENPLVHSLTHRVDGALIGAVYRICSQKGCGFDEVVTQALSDYVRANN